MTCPGSANLDLAIPGWQEPEEEEETGARVKGHIWHDLFAQAANTTARDMQRIGQAIEYVGAVRRRRRFKILVEEKVKAEWLKTAPSTIPDVVLYVKDELHIIDYKTGRIAVEVVKNPQLMYYARTVAHLAPDAKEVHLHIVQPWADTMEEWVVSAKELAEFALEVERAEARILNKDLTLVPSDKGCLFCPANPHSRGLKGTPLCPVMMELLYPSEPMDLDEVLS